MPKYKVGDTFKATLEIFDIDSEEVGLKVNELSGEAGDIFIEEYFTFEELDAAFDPNYKERKRQLKIKELEEELERLRNE